MVDVGQAVAALAVSCGLVLGWLGSRSSTEVTVAKVTPAPAAAPPMPPPAAATSQPTVAPAAAPAPSVAAAPVNAMAANTATPTRPHAAQAHPAHTVEHAAAPAHTVEHAAAPAHTVEHAVPAAAKQKPAPADNELDPQTIRLQLRAAAATFGHGQAAEALALYRRLVSAAPREAEAWRGVAVTANRLGERSEAERALRRYLQLRPNTRNPDLILQRLGNVP